MTPADQLEKPDAVHAENRWLDLTDEPSGGALGRAGFPEQLDRYINETMAAHAAVVLAKTQAAAARAEARDLTTRMDRIADELDAAFADRDRQEAARIEAERAQAILERDRAVAEARTEEVRLQIEQERTERTLLVARIGALEADRDEAMAAMTWWSRRRFLRSRDLKDRRPDQK